MEIRGNTRVFGIMGHPVQHSLSPLLHNMAFQETGYAGVYIPLDVKETGPFLKRTMQSLNLGGLSVTIPHKIWAHRMADRSDKLSQICGASNTLLFLEKKGQTVIEARNSDGPGAIQALKQATTIRGKTVLICGYGGSARAIAAQLLISEKPSRIWITGRNKARIRAFIRDLKKQFPGAAILALENNASSLPRPDVSSGKSIRNNSIQAKRQKSDEGMRYPDIIIQTTPLGMKTRSKSVTKDLPLNPELIQRGCTVFDIVYSPMITPLIALAKKKGCKVVYGYSMLLYQAVFQFRWFTGKEPPVSKWEKLLKKDLRSKSSG